eukprot:scaffold215768_cov31-Tisochrysis_lutea.AAC.4
MPMSRFSILSLEMAEAIMPPCARSISSGSEASHSSMRRGGPCSSHAVCWFWAVRKAGTS